MGSITDVAGVRVGHVTLVEEEPVVRTGVTCVLPHVRDLLAEPVPAAVHVVNGYGKPVGLSQVGELGELEAPVLLTGTFGVGAAHEGALRELLARHPDLGRPATVNPVVLECNDGRLTDLRTLAVRPRHAVAAVTAARAADPGHRVEQGAVGAGAGMVAFGWKGGIGTSSTPVLDPDGRGRRTLGALVLTNMGRAQDLVLHGRRVGGPGTGGGPDPVDGSVVVLLATDAPLDSRQLGRLARRAQNGLARTGVPTAHGSGEFVLAWSTADPTGPARRDGPWLSAWFVAVADVVEEAVLASLRSAVTTSGRDGVRAYRCPHL
ncbi:P1 family peptidase [Ornithinimicrobium sp. W1665]|uniref:P1 family peptidase n=1 Tax=Ornithinimicrobium sp. W1665 TaxID=3416666 RepID=UPI003CE84984